MKKKLTDKDLIAVLNNAETANAEDVKLAYFRLMINAPCWAFSNDLEEQRQFLIQSREGPQT
jgi:hypothetical protein